MHLFYKLLILLLKFKYIQLETKFSKDFTITIKESFNQFEYPLVKCPSYEYIENDKVRIKTITYDKENAIPTTIYQNSDSFWTPIVSERVNESVINYNCGLIENINGITYKWIYKIKWKLSKKSVIKNGSSYFCTTNMINVTFNDFYIYKVIKNDNGKSIKMIMINLLNITIHNYILSPGEEIYFFAKYFLSTKKNYVKPSCYVRFLNVPIILSIKLNNQKLKENIVKMFNEKVHLIIHNSYKSIISCGISIKSHIFNGITNFYLKQRTKIFRMSHDGYKLIIQSKLTKNKSIQINNYNDLGFFQCNSYEVKEGELNERKINYLIHPKNGTIFNLQPHQIYNDTIEGNCTLQINYYGYLKKIIFVINDVNILIPLGKNEIRMKIEGIKIWLNKERLKFKINRIILKENDYISCYYKVISQNNLSFISNLSLKNLTLPFKDDGHIKESFSVNLNNEKIIEMKINTLTATNSKKYSQFLFYGSIFVTFIIIYTVFGVLLYVYIDKDFNTSQKSLNNTSKKSYNLRKMKNRKKNVKTFLVKKIYMNVLKKRARKFKKFVQKSKEINHIVKIDDNFKKNKENIITYSRFEEKILAQYNKIVDNYSNKLCYLEKIEKFGKLKEKDVQCQINLIRNDCTDKCINIFNNLGIVYVDRFFLKRHLIMMDEPNEPLDENFWNFVMKSNSNVIIRISSDTQFQDKNLQQHFPYENGNFYGFSFTIVKMDNIIPMVSLIKVTFKNKTKQKIIYYTTFYNWKPKEYPYFLYICKLFIECKNFISKNGSFIIMSQHFDDKCKIFASISYIYDYFQWKGNSNYVDPLKYMLKHDTIILPTKEQYTYIFKCVKRIMKWKKKVMFDSKKNSAKEAESLYINKIPSIDVWWKGFFNMVKVMNNFDNQIDTYCQSVFSRRNTNLVLQSKDKKYFCINTLINESRIIPIKKEKISIKAFSSLKTEIDKNIIESFQNKLNVNNKDSYENIANKLIDNILKETFSNNKVVTKNTIVKAKNLATQIDKETKFESMLIGNYDKNLNTEIYFSEPCIEKNYMINQSLNDDIDKVKEKSFPIKKQCNNTLTNEVLKNKSIKFSHNKKNDIKNNKTKCKEFKNINHSLTEEDNYKLRSRDIPNKRKKTNNSKKANEKNISNGPILNINEIFSNKNDPNDLLIKKKNNQMHDMTFVQHEQVSKGIEENKVETFNEIQKESLQLIFSSNNDNQQKQIEDSLLSGFQYVKSSKKLFKRKSKMLDQTNENLDRKIKFFDLLSQTTSNDKRPKNIIGLRCKSELKIFESISICYLKSEIKEKAEIKEFLKSLKSLKIIEMYTINDLQKQFNENDAKIINNTSNSSKNVIKSFTELEKLENNNKNVEYFLNPKKDEKIEISNDIYMNSIVTKNIQRKKLDISESNTFFAKCLEIAGQNWVDLTEKTEIEQSNSEKAKNDDTENKNIICFKNHNKIISEIYNNSESNFIEKNVRTNNKSNILKSSNKLFDDWNRRKACNKDNKFLKYDNKIPSEIINMEKKKKKFENNEKISKDTEVFSPQKNTLYKNYNRIEKITHQTNKKDNQNDNEKLWTRIKPYSGSYIASINLNTALKDTFENKNVNSFVPDTYDRYFSNKRNLRNK